MRFLFYTHSLVSDWNHGNAHFLRGVMRELQRRGHRARALEPEGGWSRTNLLADRAPAAEAAFAARFPTCGPETYGPAFDHEAALDAADVVVVHEWTDPALVARIGRARAGADASRCSSTTRTTGP
jgi:spore maturation protein CgeB